MLAFFSTAKEVPPEWDEACGTNRRSNTTLAATGLAKQYVGEWIEVVGAFGDVREITFDPTPVLSVTFAFSQYAPSISA